MKTMKKLLTITFLLLLAGGLFNTSTAQYKKELQYYRPVDQHGIYMFTPTKADTEYSYKGFKAYVGVGLTQQWQAITEKTKGTDLSTGLKYNLTPIGPGFNLPTANLYLDAQLARGMRLHLATYLSSRHHNEAYVKGGYLRIDAFPMLNSPEIDEIMKYVTLKIGDMETNYGDAHFLRSDNANTVYNPLVGNFLMDSFTTMDGGEVYVFNKGFLAMAGIAGGQFGVRPSVANPDSRRPALYGKIGYDGDVGNGVRFRLTGSIFHSARFADLYAGDRSGSRYYNIMADAIPGYGRGGEGDPWSGRVTPGFSNGFTSFMINPYLQTGGLHLFGIIESTKEMKANHRAEQYAINAQYFLSNSVYIAGRYNIAHGYLSAAGYPNNAVPSDKETVNRVQFGAGWFLTPNILAKVEYMSQKYKKFPVNSVYYGGEFNGLMIEAAIAF